MITRSGDSDGLTNAAVTRWIAVWANAWRTHDADALTDLYTDDAVFVSEPFREPKRGGAGAVEYAAWAFADEERVELWFAEPLVAPLGAAVRYWAISRDREGRDSTLAGISDLRFAPDGRVCAQRDHWNVAAGALRPPPDWGPIAAHERSA